MAATDHHDAKDPRNRTRLSTGNNARLCWCGHRVVDSTGYRKTRRLYIQLAGREYSNSRTKSLARRCLRDPCCALDVDARVRRVPSYSRRTDAHHLRRPGRDARMAPDTRPGAFRHRSGRGSEYDRRDRRTDSGVVTSVGARNCPCRSGLPIRRQCQHAICRGQIVM